MNGLNNRVINLMCLMAEHGFITIKEIEKIYKFTMIAHRYLKILEELKLIDNIETHLKPKTAYYLTDSGYKYLESIGRLRVLKRFVKSDYRLTRFFHITMGLQVRLIFQKNANVLDYRSEKVVAYYYELQSGNLDIKKKSKQCDAEMIIKTKNGEYKAGIEIELTSKSFKRVFEAIRSIDVHRDDLHVVLWVASSEVIIRDLQRAIKTLMPQLRHPRKHLFILWDELKVRELDAAWNDVNGQKKKLFETNAGDSTKAENI